MPWKKKSIRFMMLPDHSPRNRAPSLYLAWLAIAVFLFAGASVHSHASGWHTTQACSICALEDMSAQGAALTTAPIAVAPMRIVSPAQVAIRAVHTLSLAIIPIRAPPFFS